MQKALFILALGLATTLVGCQQSSPATETPATAEAPATTTAPAADILSVNTQEAARAAVGRYIQSQPNAQLYVIDSARVVDVDTHWQVLVPRTDWAKRMPNRARFEVDKVNGMVQGLPVK